MNPAKGGLYAIHIIYDISFVYGILYMSALSLYIIYAFSAPPPMHTHTYMHVAIFTSKFPLHAIIEKCQLEALIENPTMS